MKKLLKFSFFLALCLSVLTSCSDDDDNSLSIELDGVLVLNEGLSSGSISFINTVTDSVVNKVFAKKNDIDLGKLPQSMAFSDKYIFITVTTSTGTGFVEVVDRSTLEHVTYLDGLSYPREVTVGDKYAYVSNGKYRGSIFSISLSTLEMSEDSIIVGYGPEKMIISNDKLFVANSGGWASDSTVSVIDLIAKTVVDTIYVKHCPRDMVKDANGDIWVYCGGAVDYSNYPNVSYTNAGLSKISGLDYSVNSFDFLIPNGAIKSIAINKAQDEVYYITDAVYSMNINDNALPVNAFINKIFYGIDVDPVTGNIWACDVQSYTDPSNVEVYSKDGLLLKSYQVGVIPNSSTFNR